MGNIPSGGGVDLGLFAGAEDDAGLGETLAKAEREDRRRLERVWRGVSVQPKTCGSCRVRLLWAVTPAGKWMPLNATPDPAGPVWTVRCGAALVALVATKERQPPADAARYRTHFETCPAAERHRRRPR